ncbi:Cytochrome P450 [Quillaja saponaria]|uniref:Cytochrome P450 n=1 Tax=Quillaja saponaria TaxID=32244 RepID=A0AAD7Q1I8_QUISA|nr:Cytochrome P450 [Quillaja saponaria]
MANSIGAAILVALIVLFVSKIFKVCLIVFWRPYALTKYFQKQGVTGPPYSLLSGSLHEIKQMIKNARETVLDTNSNDFTERVLPHYHKWSLLYGETFLYWFGTQPRLCICEVELAKQILSNKFGFFLKPKTRPLLYTMIGKGLVLFNGLDWVNRRRLLTPAFSMNKLKVMIKRMAACTISMLDEWKNQAIEAEGKSKKIEMNKEFRDLTADIIAHSAFGSSLVQGKEAFKAQRELQQICVASVADIFIPGSQYLPTPSNIQVWKLDKKLRYSIWSIIESRLLSEPTKDSSGYNTYGDDLLGLMMEATEMNKTQTSFKFNMNDIMEECKSFFFAGHETTSNLLTWTVFLLSLHNEWQEKLRQEVLQECGMEIPSADMLAKLKLVNMVLLEALRLYGPVLELVREATQDMKLGNLLIPKGTCLAISMLMIHRSKEYWGEDANEFNPLRFKDGVSKAAKHPNALLAFSVGPRACIGQNFAMLEAKTVIALILQRFSLSLSPDYKHTPVNNLTLQAQNGLPIIIKPLNL